MNGSWRIGRLAGIHVRIHFTFALLFGVLAIMGVVRGASAAAVLSAALTYVVLFGSVLLHELGHALTGRRFGVKTRDITLLPFGGVAQMDGMSPAPWAELWIALAGPAVNLAIAAALFGGVKMATGAVPFVGKSLASLGFLEQALAANVSLALFNLLPAFPMDGGRVVRALLAYRLGAARATRIAAGLGKAMAVLIGLLGLVAGPTLLLIAFFVWFGAGQEVVAAQAHDALKAVPVERLMQSEFLALSPRDRLFDAAEAMLSERQRDAPVLSGGRLVGVLTREALLLGLAAHGPDGLVEGAMRRDVQPFHHAESLQGALAQAGGAGVDVFPVADGERVVGVLSLDRVATFTAVRAALEQHRAGANRAPREARSEGTSGG